MRLNMTAAETQAFVLNHPEAAESLFASAAQNQREHLGKGFGNMLHKAVSDSYRQSVKDARCVSGVAEAIQPKASALNKAAKAMDKLAERSINLRADQTFSVRMDAAHWNAFAKQHTDAARQLFRIAERHLAPEGKGVVHRMNMMFDGKYREQTRDARAIRAMASSLGSFRKSHPQKAAETEVSKPQQQAQPQSGLAPEPVMAGVPINQAFRSHNHAPQGQDIIETTITTQTMAAPPATGPAKDWYKQNWYGDGKLANPGKAAAKGMGL